MDAELEKLDFSRFGSGYDRHNKEVLKRYISAIKIFFKKLKLIHIVFKIDSTRQTSTPWYAPQPYEYGSYVIDNFGNAYTIHAVALDQERYLTGSDYVTVPDVPPGQISKFWFRKNDSGLVDEDAIIASGTPLSDAQISFIKAGIPSITGTAIAGSDYNESQFRLLFQMLPLLQNVAKETFAVYQAASR